MSSNLFDELPELVKTDGTVDCILKSSQIKDTISGIWSPSITQTRIVVSNATMMYTHNSKRAALVSPQEPPI